MLIERCLCGRIRPAAVRHHNGLAIAECHCGVQRLLTSISPDEYQEQYFGKYHRAADRHPNCVPYTERYEHDRGIAATRWRRYVEVIGPSMHEIRSSLDVGAANGAFVDYLAQEIGVDAWGLDPDPSAGSDVIFTGGIADIGSQFDLITYHDVLEHILDPRREVDEAVDRLNPGGLLIADVPDVSTPAGHHHYKAEHPWYFTQESLEGIFRAAGLVLCAFDVPITGKMVLYMRKP